MAKHSWLNYFPLHSVYLVGLALLGSRLRECSGRLSSPVHEATVLEVITVSPDLQLPAGEAFTLVEGDLKEDGKKEEELMKGMGGERYLSSIAVCEAGIRIFSLVLKLAGGCRKPLQAILHYITLHYIIFTCQVHRISQKSIHG